MTFSETYSPQALFESFKPTSFNDFTHELKHGFNKPNPMGSVARVALERLAPGAEIEAPLDYTRDTLDRISWMSGYYDQPQRVSGTQATELAFIGKQILNLNENGLIQPPLTEGERQEIDHVVDTVAQNIPDWESIVRIPGVNFPGELTMITAASE